MKDNLSIKKTKSTATIKSEEFASSLINNSGLKKKIFDIISKTDKSISLQHLVKHLSEKYFDGNYHPILNELEQLEREGEIGGQVINGKVFYRKKQKTTRKYILRKGKNFRKYIG
jgi:Fe2+ or Zn2+ uptake regulation protein